MDDLISRKALLKRLHDVGGCGAPPESWADGYDKAIDLAYGMAENAPTIDPVHASGACYCRECKYQDECICRIEFIGRNPILEQNTYEYHPLHFCSNGQRREGSQCEK